MVARRQTKQIPMSSTNAQRQFGDVLRRVHSGEEHVIVQQNGLAVAVVISVSEYDELMKERELREAREKRAEALSRQFGEEAQRRGLTEEQLLDSLQETKQTVYQEKYGKPTKS